MDELAFLAGRDIAVYSESWCPDCTRLDRWIAQKRLAWRKVLLSTTPGAAEKLEAETGKRAVPFLLVEGRAWVRGYHKESPLRFDERLLLAELRSALGE